MKWLGFLLGVLALISEKGIAQTNPTPSKTPKTETIYIPTGNPPPATTENFSQPFFAATPDYEVNEEVEQLKSRVEKLEKIVETLQADKMVKTQPEGQKR